MSKILVIDDEPEIRNLIQQVLETKGHNVVGAGSAKEGIAQIYKESPDVIILDIRMPDEGGLAVANELFNKNLSIPFVLCTATVLDDPIQAYELFVVRHLYAGTLKKPFEIDEVYTMVERGLQLKKKLAAAS